MADYQIPKGKSTPHTGYASDALWIELTPRIVDHQTTLNRGGGIKLGAQGADTFTFLAPETIMETITNDWGEYEGTNAVKSLSNKVSKGERFFTETGQLSKALGKGAVNTMKDFLSKGFVEGGKASLDRFRNADALATTIPQHKIDTPLVYTGSNRREWQWIFQMVAFKDPYHEVVLPVRKLMQYASPEIDTQSQIGIKLPYVFKINTIPNDLIVAKLAALKTVQPLWQYPFINGYPVRCELTLIFQDISPLYRNIFQEGDFEGGVVRVVNEKEIVKEKQKRLEQERLAKSGGGL